MTTRRHLLWTAGAGTTAVLAASLFHFGEATIADAKRALAAAHIPVRMA